jgi:dienelactone hydrolase
LEVPLLALHGEEDKVLPAECSRTLVQRAVSHGANAKLSLLTKDTHQMESAFPHVLDFIINLSDAGKSGLMLAALAAAPLCLSPMLLHRFTDSPWMPDVA